MILIILEFSRALGETADGPAELFDHEGVRVIAPIWPYHGARPEKYFVDGTPAFLQRVVVRLRHKGIQPAPQRILWRWRLKAWRYASIVHIDGYELEEGWVRVAMWLTSASPGGFHDWKTLYQDLHRFYMWLHTYLDEAKLHYCSPTVPLLQVQDNADPIYSKKQQ